MLVMESEKRRIVKSENYNTIMDKQTGLFARWGKTINDDPIKAPMPEIADIEISSGKCHNACPFCYKQNNETNALHNMTFDQFKDIFHKLAKTVVDVEYNNGEHRVAQYNKSFRIYDEATNKQQIIEYTKERLAGWEIKDIKDIKVYNRGLLSQIAFGITSPYDNPDFFRMMEYARAFDVIPNYTCNGTDMTSELAERTSKLCGAVAISCCSDREKSYDAIKMLTDLGMEQVNIHMVSMQSTFETIMSLFNDIKTDKRLERLNAVVLLKYKPKGTNAGKFTQLTQEQYNQIFAKSMELGINIGFDSCSCHSFLEAIKDNPKYDKLSALAEPCESTLFSIYINSECNVFPCSFCEEECRNNLDWKNGINLLEADSLETIWNSERFEEFRTALLNSNRRCPIFEGV